MKHLIAISLFIFLLSCGNNKYEILKEDINMNVCRMQVKLNQKESKSELEKIAFELRNNRKTYDKLWISFFQPDLLPDKSGNGAWAVASFTPELEVQILGEEISSTNIGEEEVIFPKYSSIMEMIEAAGDFQGNQVENIVTEEGNNHIRVSSEFLKGEDESNIKEQVKRDIVYVVFQTFAQTDLNEVTITSIPIIRNSFNPNLEYDGKLQESLKETIFITRSRGVEILQKYLQTNSFQDLYQLDGTIYLPNAKFNRLKFDEMNNVFSELKE